MIDFKEITDRAVWQDFVSNRPFYTFLHSFEWGEFQTLLGHKIFRIGGHANGRLIGLALLIKIEAKRSTFLLCPHGPLLNGVGEKEFFRELTDFLIFLGRKEKVDFIRLSTILENTSSNNSLLKKLGYRFAPMHQHAETTWLLDLNSAEADLMKGLRKTTRYLVKRAVKEGVTVVKAADKPAIDKFISLHQRHAAKNSYEAFNSSYVKKLFQVFPKENISLKFASYQGEVEAAALVIFYGQTAAYYLGASQIKHPQFSPAYLLQWQSIVEAKNRGIKLYNFWGISPDNNPRHPIYGVSLFKKGFGGYEEDLLHAYDYPLTKKYWLNWLVETIRRKKRGYYYLPAR